MPQRSETGKYILVMYFGLNYYIEYLLKIPTKMVKHYHGQSHFIDIEFTTR